ncbi:MAG: purine-nucleoside phosphorylase, partial [Ruminococcaceae bacterium]|nr:purine-nucleoside phosphorylase [Oscillospiraceae bacterium]
MPTEGAWQIKMDQLQQKLEEYKERITASVEVLRTAVSRIPDCLLVLGSGLGALADQVGDPVVLPYDTLPGFSRTSVAGHQGRLLFGWWQNRYVAVMQGRFHYYEGYGMADVVLPIRVMCRLGVPRLILTNAAGGVRRNLRPGDLMLIEDHIGLFAESPLRGPNDAMFGPRFPDQFHVCDPVWRALAAFCAADMAIPLHSWVYAWCRGPQYETPAEIRLLERLGADAV